MVKSNLAYVYKTLYTHDRKPDINVINNLYNRSPMSQRPIYVSDTWTNVRSTFLEKVVIGLGMYSHAVDLNRVHISL